MSNPNQVFNTVKFKAPRRSLQDLSHTYKSVTDFGQIIPIGLFEIAPGDVMKKSTQVFMRAMPMIAPILHECDVYVHDFFVPWRLIWPDYEKFLIPQSGETAETIPVKPYVVPNSSWTATQKAMIGKNTLWDYFGLPVLASNGTLGAKNADRQICDLPFRAYQLIWNEYYRDQNLQAEIDRVESSGETSAANFGKEAILRYRAWEKDYFTSALPRPQKGEPIGIELDSVPVGSRLEVYLDKTGGEQIYENANGSQVGSGTAAWSNGRLTGGGNIQWMDPNGSLYVTTEPGTSGQGYFTIEMLREAMRLQEFMESLMRGGSRYSEVVRNMFGQIPDDLRLGRPAYLGGGKQNLVISEVLQTSESTPDTSALGDMAGHGLSIGSSNYWKALFKEHGYVLSLMSVRPRSAYMQGVNKLWLKNDRYEEMWPLFAHLGEQPVMNGELFWSWTDGHNRDTFGYQPIYTEYRNKPSLCTGELRDSLDFWHLNRKFASRPSLNADFITCTPSETNRVFAATEAASGQHLIFEAAHQVKMVRCIPRDGVPML